MTRRFPNLTIYKLTAASFAAFWVVTANASVSIPTEDLRHGELASDSSFDLEQGWAVFLGEFIQPEALNLQAPGWTIQPSVFELRHLSSGQEPVHIATYATKVLLPEANQPLALIVPRLFAATIFITDGEQILNTIKHGHPGRTRDTTYSVYREELVPLPTKLEELVVVIHQANFDHARGGISNAMKLGPASKLYKHQVAKRVGSAMLIGLLIIIGVYHIVIFLLRRSDETPLFFGLLSGIAALREFIMGRIAGELTWLNTNLMLTKLEYLTIPLSLLCLERYISKLLDHNDPPKWLQMGYAGAAFFLVGLSCFGDTELITSQLNYFQLYAVIVTLYAGFVIWSGAREGNLHAKWLALALGLLGAALINDILLGQALIESSYLVPYAFTGFVFLQAILISQKSARAFEERDETQHKLLQAYQDLDEELLNRENLIKVNQSLEHEISEAGQQLIQADKLATLGTVVAGVAHDIASPSGLIMSAQEVISETRQSTQELLKQIFEGDDSAEAKEVLALFLTKLKDMEQAESDVGLGISRINAIQSAIRNQSRNDQEETSFPLKALVDECLIILNTKLKSVKVLNQIPMDATLIGRRSQIGQVYTNLISNAADAVLEKFAHDREFEPVILLRINHTSDGLLQLSVQDNGPGIPENIREKILEAFFTTKPLGKGTGLGMSIILKILERHEFKLKIGTSSELGGAEMLFEKDMVSQP